MKNGDYECWMCAKGAVVWWNPAFLRDTQSFPHQFCKLTAVFHKACFGEQAVRSHCSMSTSNVLLPVCGSSSCDKSKRMTCSLRAVSALGTTPGQRDVVSEPNNCREWWTGEQRCVPLQTVVGLVLQIKRRKDSYNSVEWLQVVHRDRRWLSSQTQCAGLSLMRKATVLLHTPLAWLRWSMRAVSQTKWEEVPVFQPSPPFTNIIYRLLSLAEFLFLQF